MVSVQQPRQSPGDAAGRSAPGPDRGTARLLHRILSSDVVAFVATESDVVAVWLMLWTGDAQGMEFRPVILSSTERAVAGMPQPGDAAVVWPDGLTIALDGSGPPSVRVQLVIPLVVSRAQRIAWCLGRQGRQFSNEDVELATLIAPGLLSRLGRSAVATHEIHSTVLTPREQVIAEFVAQGLTSRAVAHRLKISERTVHKHLEHIYRKTDCADRLTAILRLRETSHVDS